MPNSNEKGELMQKEIPLVKSKSKFKSRIPKRQIDQRLRRDYSEPEDIIKLGTLMVKAAKEDKLTIMTQVARAVGYKPDELLHLVEDHPPLVPFHEECKMICGLNAYEGIENRTLTGTFSKYSVSKYLKEIRQERDAIKLEEHQREIEKILARKEAQKEQYQEIITEIREKDGKKIAVVSVDENILMPDEE